MAAEVQEADEGNRVFTKEVRVVAYDDDLEFPSLRDWVQEVTGIDVTSTETMTDEWWELNYDLGMGEQTHKLQTYEVNEEEAKKVKNKLKRSGVDVVSLNHKTERKQKMKNTVDQAARQFRNALTEDLPHDLFAGVELQKSWGWWYNEENQDYYVKLTAADFGERRVLAKESERESDDLYETMSEVPSFSVMVKMRAPAQQHIDKWTDEMIPALTKLLSQNPAIGKVRFMGCEKSVVEQGECYNI